MENKHENSIGEQVVTSTLWMGLWRWSARLVGFATIIVLARILLPEDFGVVATGGIIIGFFVIMIDLGTDSYLIPLKDPDRDDYDTAWTLRLLVISVASIAIYFAAQPGADYFDDQRLVDVVQLLAMAGWLGGFTNIGLTMYRRELKFREIAIIGISKRLSSSVITISLAFWLQNYWAMVIGQIVFMMVGLILSYIRHDYRPRFTLVCFRKQWKFGQWIIARNLATFMQSQGDSFIVAKFFGIEWMGIYSMAARFAALPTKQILEPALPPIYSGLAKKHYDADVFVSNIMKVIGTVAFLMLPAATLFATLSEQLIVAVLGERWIAVIPIVVPLTITIMLGMLVTPVGSALTIKGRVKLLAGLNWFSAFSVVAVLYAAAQWNEIEIFAWARVVITAFTVMLYYAYLRVILNISLVLLLANIYRPVIASLVLALIVFTISALLDSVWLNIIAAVCAGGAGYLLTAVLLWRLAGSPDSGEALLVGKLMRVLKRKLNRYAKL